MILVTGSTGTVGRELIKQLDAAGAEFKVLARDAERARALLGPEVDIVEGNLAKPETLDAALGGVEKAFLLSPADPGEVELHSSFIRAAKRAGTKHIVRLSALAAEWGPADPPIKLRRVHRISEEELEASGIAYTHLRPHYFTQNLLHSGPTIAEQGVFYAPMKDAKVAMVDVRDIAAVAAAALTEPGHEGKTYVITGPEAISFGEIAEKMSAALDKTVKYVDVPTEQARQGMIDAGFSEWLADALIEIHELFWEGEGEVVTTVVADVTKNEARSFDEFVRDYAEAFRTG